MSLLYRWRQDAATAALASAAAAKAPPTFVPVVVEAAPATPPPRRPARKRPGPAGVAPTASIIEIDLAGGHTLRATADVDAVALARIVAALESKS